jgi:hypothetical protein
MAREAVFAFVLGSLLATLDGSGGDRATRLIGAGPAALTHGTPAIGTLIGGGVGAVGDAVTSP